MEMYKMRGDIMMKVVLNEKIKDNNINIISVLENTLLEKDFWGINDELKYLFEEKVFEGKKGQFHFFHKEANCLLIGLGEKEKLNEKTLRAGATKAVKESKRMKFNNITYYCGNVENTLKAVETVILADYKFEKFKEEKSTDGIDILNIINPDVTIDELNEKVKLAESVLVARDLSNDPANSMTPKVLAEAAIDFGKEYGFEVEILNKEEIEKENMHAYLAVSLASTEEPKFIIMRYKGDSASDKTYGLVGKGITYDAGGLSIKPTSDMITMKEDMSGASAVIGAMVAISRNKLKANVTGVIAAAENMIAGNSYKPGDILSTRGGKTIFIDDTDAEGRITLVDALHYTVDKEKTAEVIDIATLTGSIVTALGRKTTGMMGNNDSMKDKLRVAADKSDERVWELPIFDDDREATKHHEADLRNLGGKPGAMTAAALLEYFVEETPWVHLDIAGTSWTHSERDYFPKGATGVGVRLLYNYIKECI